MLAVRHRALETCLLGQLSQDFLDRCEIPSPVGIFRLRLYQARIDVACRNKLCMGGPRQGESLLKVGGPMTSLNTNKP